MPLLRIARQAVNWVRRQEGLVLFVALVVVAALFVFARVTDEVLEGGTRGFDEWVLRGLRDPERPERPIGPGWLIGFARDITVLGGQAMLVLVIVLVLGYLVLDHKFGAMWLVIAAATGGGLLTTGLKYLVARERPDVVPHIVSVLSPSFPSGHSMLAAIVYLTLGALLARVAERRRVRTYFITAALVLTGLVGGSRVYLGVHYPTDVLAGWALGLAWALLCWLVARYLQSRGKVEG
jgi:undecaprenyl-diphosphatase